MGLPNNDPLPQSTSHMAVTFRRMGRAAIVTLTAPPVNAIGQSIRQGLQDVLARLPAEEGLTRVILTGSERAFAAGADIREFDAAPVAPHLNEICAAIERCEVPWIAAISGAALGGGCELALACRFRIARPGVRIGLPEVTLGVVPGAGGTQRLPRLVGMRQALDMISTGQPVTAEAAEASGLIDGIAEDPVAVALHLDEGSVALALPVCDRPVAAADPDAVDAALARVAERMPQQDAPLRAVHLVAAATLGHWGETLAEERAAFLGLRQGAQARALRHMFFAEGAASSRQRSNSASVLSHVVVAGGGTMGCGISHALRLAGLQVILLEADEDGLARAEAGLARCLADTQAQDGRGDAQGLGRVVLSTDYADAAGADLAIEAVCEDMRLKQAVLAGLEAHLSPGTVLTTTTVDLDLGEMASGLRDASRLVGLQFVAPAHATRLLEVVRGAVTSDNALAQAKALADRLRKVPVMSNGFVGHRILARYHEAADTVLLDGSTPWEIDEAMVAFGFPMGPYEAQDLAGLDIAYAQRQRQAATRDPARRYIPIADRMIELGKLGRKTGAGWYRYPGGNGKVDDPIVADLALEEAHFAGITRVEYDEEEIRERLLLAMINEAAACLQDGISGSAQDIDLVSVLGGGFPRWRGGLMHYADTLGAAHIVERLLRLAQEDPVAWRVSPVLLDCARSGRPLSEARPGSFKAAR